MFVPVWIFVTFFVLYFIRIAIACIFRQKMINKFKDVKFPNIIKSFDASFDINGKQIHAYIDKEGKFTVDIPIKPENE